MQKLWAILSLLEMALAASPLLSLLQKEHDELLESYRGITPEHYYVDDEHAEIISPRQVLELDLHIRPVGNVSGALALLNADDDEIATGGSGFLEKNLSDFFDIQIFSTVYFGSR